MLWGGEVGTGPFMCTYRAYISGTERKFVQTIAGTVCKGRAHDATCKIEAFCPCFMTHEFKPTEFHATCCGENILSPQ